MWAPVAQRWPIIRPWAMGPTTVTTKPCWCVWFLTHHMTFHTNTCCPHDQNGFSVPPPVKLHCAGVGGKGVTWATSGSVCWLWAFFMAIPWSGPGRSGWERRTPLRCDRTTAKVLVVLFGRGCLTLLYRSNAPGLFFAVCALFNDEEQTVGMDLNRNLAPSLSHPPSLLYSLTWSASRRARSLGSRSRASSASRYTNTSWLSNVSARAWGVLAHPPHQMRKSRWSCTSYISVSCAMRRWSPPASRKAQPIWCTSSRLWPNLRRCRRACLRATLTAVRHLGWPLRRTRRQP